MDIKAEITKIANKLKGDKSLLESFKKNPIDIVKSLIGDKIAGELSNDVLDKIVEGVKAKLKLDNASGLLSKLKGLFKK